MRTFPSVAASVAMALLLAAPAVSGPVSGDTAEASVNGSPALPGQSSDPPAAAPIEAPLAAGARPAVSAGSDATANTSQQAAEIMREAQADATTADTPQPAPRPGAQATRPAATNTPPTSASTQPPGIEDDFRKAGKAALQWLKDTVPGLRKEPQDDEGSRATVEVIEWSASPLDGSKANSHAGVGTLRSADRSGTVPLALGTAAVYGSNAPTQGLGPQGNIVREIIDVFRMVVEHPMTWLIVALFVIGGYAMSKFDRRPK